MTESKFFNVGPSGGYGGTFKTDLTNDATNEIKKMVEIDLAYGGIVAGIRAEVQDSTGAETQFEWHGDSNGSSSQTISLGESEFLIGVTGTYADLVNNIEFHTAIYKDGNIVRTPSYGPYAKNGRNADFAYWAPTGWQIVGFNARSGSALDAFGVILGKMPTMPQSN